MESVTKGQKEGTWVEKGRSSLLGIEPVLTQTCYTWWFNSRPTHGLDDSFFFIRLSLTLSAQSSLPFLTSCGPYLLLSLGTSLLLPLAAHDCSPDSFIPALSCPGLPCALSLEGLSFLSSSPKVLAVA